MLARPSARRRGCAPPATRRAPRPAVRRPRRPVPAGSAPPRPSSTTSTCRCALRQRHPHGGAVGAAVLGGVGERLGDDEPGGGLDRHRRLARHVDGRRGGHRAAGGQRGDGRAEAALLEQARPHAAREVAQLGERPLGLLARLADELARALGIAVEALLGHAEVHAPAPPGAPGRRRAGRARSAAARRRRRRRRRRASRSAARRGRRARARAASARGGPARARAGAGSAGRPAAARRRGRRRRPTPPTCRS